MAELAGITRKGRLVSRQEWETQVNGLRKAAATAMAGKDGMIEELSRKIIAAVDKRLPKRKFGIMLSGGVDSSLIAFAAKKLGGDFTCYSVGIEGSRDVEEAINAAEKLQLQLKYKLFTLTEAEKTIAKANAVVGEPNVVNVGVAAVEIAAAELAKDEGVTTFFGGLGSEEIFAGYQRHETAEDVNEECWNGLSKMWERDLIRDHKVAAATKVNLLTPFLDKELIITAMRIPAIYKISDSEKKIILRETAVAMGLPAGIAFRKKMAAQYGSGFDRAIEKLARKKGFKLKKDYLASLPK